MEWITLRKFGKSWCLGDVAVLVIQSNYVIGVIFQPEQRIFHEINENDFREEVLKAAVYRVRESDIRKPIQLVWNPGEKDELKEWILICPICKAQFVVQDKILRYQMKAAENKFDLFTWGQQDMILAIGKVGGHKH